jgi:SAM-dependent methyltransferase
VSSASDYEAHAQQFLAARDASLIGADVVSRWAKSLPAGTDVVEIACGGGYPVTRALVGAGVNVWAIDGSPTLLEKFRSRFPTIPTQCSLALESDYFGRKFGAALAIGLMFLLEEAEQIALIHRASEILLPGGRFLFTAPLQSMTWRDVVTGQESRSLGETRYVQILESAGFRVIGTFVDEGENYHYDAELLQ